MGKKSIVRKFLIYGIFFGLLFPVGAFLLIAAMEGEGITMNALLKIQLNQPSFWIIQTAPFVLGLAGYLIGIREYELEDHKRNLEEMLIQRTKEVDTQNKLLLNEIKERKNDQREVLQQKHYFEALVDNSPLAIILLDTKDQIVGCNPAFTNLFEYELPEILGQNIDDLVVPDDERQAAHDVTQKALQGETTHIVTKRKNKSGLLIDVEVFGVPVIVEGFKVGVLGLYHDISEHKRTLRDLRQAKLDAEAAAETKAEFLANMSHEIRTPLNAVIGMGSLLFDTDLNEEQLDFAQTIRSSGDTLLTLINDILDFSKAEAGKMALEKQPFNLRQVIETSLDLVAPRAVKKGIELAYIIEDFVPSKLIGDVTRLQQILVNLLNNAVKFTETGEVVILINSQLKEKNDFELHFQVKDTGIGIPEDRMSRLFKSFSQVDASTTRKYGGTGLGLAISEHLVSLMNGRIWAESQLGQGSTFHFTIITQASPSTDPLQPLVDQPDLSGLHLLIVDDNKTNRKILQLYSEKWGMKATAFESGIEALDLLKQGEQFDLAILDMQMPDIDGMTLAQELHRLVPIADLPLVLLSSIGSKFHEHEEIYHFSAILNKPIKPSRLFNVLMDVIAESTPLLQKRTIPLEKHFDTSLGEEAAMHILLVEDNAVNQKVATKLLEKLGYVTDLAANGLEAIDSLKRQDYELVFMDVQMPEMDGEEATKQIRSEFPDSRQPWIVAMTANALNGDRERYLSIGMDDYISKPINVNQLQLVLKNAYEAIQEKR